LSETPKVRVNVLKRTRGRSVEKPTGCEEIMFKQAHQAHKHPPPLQPAALVTAPPGFVLVRVHWLDTEAAADENQAASSIPIGMLCENNDIMRVQSA